MTRLSASRTDTGPGPGPGPGPDSRDGVGRLLHEIGDGRPPDPPVPGAGPPGDDGVRPRLARLAGAVDGGSRRNRPRDVRRLLNTIGVVAIGLGIAAVLLGWYGASHSPYLYQEIPYLISGGLLGLALVVAGGVVVTSGWSLRQIQEARRDTQAMVRSLERIEFALRVAARPEPGTPDTGAGARPAAGGGR